MEKKKSVHVDRAVRGLLEWSREEMMGLGDGVGKGEDEGFKRCLNVKSTEASDGINMERGK